MKRDISLYLKDIVENMGDAEGFIRNLVFKDFAQDKKTINAVVRSIEVVGEAVKQIPEEIRLKKPDVPWKNMAGMRDKCIHNYFGVDPEMIWSVVRDDIPRLKPLIQALLEEIKSG